MPRRDDLESILVLGSGPIVIGQAGEFDYSGTQACRALRADGYRVILVNSNPATIMTDPGVADRTYVEPLDLRSLEAIIAKERPHALLPTLGGQTALNLAVELDRAGVLERFGTELIGATAEAIHRAEDRDAFREAMRQAGLEVPRSAVVTSVEEGRSAIDGLGLPVILRPGFTLGGYGGGIARSREELDQRLTGGLEASPISQVLIEESVLGWGEFELEVMRDRNDNAVIVCSIENIDPMGIHTGDSVTVAPAMTLSDTELQDLRDATLAVVRAIGVETGGANVQFALNRDTGRLLVIEANPRASRTVPFVAKATGVPLVSHAVRLMLGAGLDELDLPARGAARHVAVKEAVLPFDRFPDADPMLGPEMRATGEAMALGGSVEEAFAKAQRGAGQELPMAGTVFISARDRDKPRAVAVAGRLSRAGLGLCATEGTAGAIRAAGVRVETVGKLGEGSPDAVALVDAGQISMVVNMPSGGGAHTDGRAIRKAAVRARIPCITSIQAAEVAASTIASGVVGTETPIALQDIGSGVESPRLREAAGPRTLGMPERAR